MGMVTVFNQLSGACWFLGCWKYPVAKKLFLNLTNAEPQVMSVTALEESEESEESLPILPVAHTARHFVPLESDLLRK